MKNFLFFLSPLIILSCASDNENTSDSESVDLIVGLWTETGGGFVTVDGTDQFTGFDYFCVTLGRYDFNSDGSFRVETFDGPDDNCSSSSVIAGTWENREDTYLLSIISDSSNQPETGEQANIRIIFPDNSTMRWLFESTSEEIDYSYEQYERVN